MEIKSLAGINFDTIYKAFSLAFAEYEVQLNYEELKTMLIRRGYNPELSFAAFDKDNIVAFTLNGAGSFNGIPTVYDTGTGTLKEYRSRGLATKIFEYSIPFLKEANMQQYLLEVMQHNTKAVSVYKNLGFEISREFCYFRQHNNKIINKIKNSSFLYSVKPIDIEAFEAISTLWDFYPSWQNSMESIKRGNKDLICLGVFLEKVLAGYCVFEPNSGDITQLAVDKKYRRRGIGSILLKEMLELNRNEWIKLINTEVVCSSITGFLKEKNIIEAGKQFEMVRNLS